MTSKLFMRRLSRAYTLIEMVLALAVFAILVSLGVPAIDQSIRNNRVAAQHNELVALLRFAKSEAIRRSTRVPVVLTPTEGGWDAFVEDPSAEAEVVGCVPGQLRCASNTQITLVASTAELTFNGRGYIREADDAWAAEILYLQHENCAGQNQRRRIDITPTGQVSWCRLPCDSTAACPP